jgi:hypothetical protein
VCPETHVDELRPCHDAVLTRRDLRDHGVDGSRGTKSAICAGERPLDPHAPTVARAV